MTLSRAAVVYLLLAWTLVALYPDPTVLVTSVANLARPEADGEAAAALAAGFPDDPRRIEEEVLGRISYATDWETQGVPWRFPSASEAVTEGRGDCETRALVLASVLAAKGIPYELRLSIDHIWVDYPGKVPTANENDALVLAERGEDGFRLRLPEDFSLWRELESQVRMYWDPMPWPRRLLLAAGLLLIPMGARRARRLHGMSYADAPTVYDQGERRWPRASGRPRLRTKCTAGEPRCSPPSTARSSPSGT